MRIYLAGLRLTHTLRRAMIASGVTLVEKPAAGVDLIGFAPRSLTLLDEARALREAAPGAHLCIAVPARRLHEAKWMQALLESPRDEVWVIEHWQEQFWLSAQKALLGRLAEKRATNAEAQLAELKRHYEELSASSTRLIRQIERDVSLATDIQRSLLPRRSPRIPGVAITAKFVAAAGVGGDYYDVFELDDRKRLGVLMADSQTHGIAAALLSVLLKTRIEDMKDRFPDSKSFMEYLNREIREHHGDSLAQTAILYGILDRLSLSFRFTSAGHLRPLVWRDGQSVSVPPSHNPPIGAADQYSFEETVVDLRPGDLLFLHTGGLAGPLGTVGGDTTPALRSLLGKFTARPDPLEVQNELLALVRRFQEGKTLDDDITMLQISIDEKVFYVAGGSR